MHPVRVLIVDDEEITREDLRKLLADDPDVMILGSCSNGLEALATINGGGVDIVLLDIQMPGMSGFDVLRQVGREKLPAIVFVTAHDEFALQAFAFHAVDYLLKPFTEQQFRVALAHAKEVVQLQSLSEYGERLHALIAKYEETSMHGETARGQNERKEEGDQARWIQRIPVGHGGKINFIGASDVQWIEAANNYVKLYTERATHLLRETIAHCECRFDPSRFVRIHRSAIVNSDFIQEVRPYFMGEYVVVLKDGRRLRVSRNRRAKFRKFMNLK